VFTLAATQIERMIWLAQPIIAVLLFLRLYLQRGRRHRRPAWARMTPDRVIETATKAFESRDPGVLVPVLIVDQYPSLTNAMCWRVRAWASGHGWSAEVHDDTGVVDIREPAELVWREADNRGAYSPSPSGRPRRRLRF
jgi:hypothetical protein